MGVLNKTHRLVTGMRLAMTTDDDTIESCPTDRVERDAARAGELDCGRVRAWPTGRSASASDLANSHGDRWLGCAVGLGVVADRRP